MEIKQVKQFNISNAKEQLSKMDKCTPTSIVIFYLK